MGRWHQPPASEVEKFFTFDRTWAVCKDAECAIDLVAIWVWPIVFLMGHMAVMLPCMVMPEALGCGAQMTSYKWMTRKKDLPLVRLTEGRSGPARVLIIYLLAFVYNLVLFLPVPLLYMNQIAHATFLFSFFLIAVIN